MAASEKENLLSAAAILRKVARRVEEFKADTKDAEALNLIATTLESISKRI